MKKYTLAFALVAFVVIAVGTWFFMSGPSVDATLQIPVSEENAGALGSVSSAPSTPTPPEPAPSGPKTFTLADVAVHNSAASCYTAINGSVYDVTSWIGKHPGGSKAILSLCGKDGSSVFDKKHGGQPRPEQELANFKIGLFAN